MADQEKLETEIRNSFELNPAMMIDKKTMPVNHYFQGGDGIGSDAEKRLHENLIIENLKIYGHAVYYLPRTLVNRDLILVEDSASRLDDSYLIEMYFETTEGFHEQEIISKFGLEVRDDTTFVVSKRRFLEQVDDPLNLMIDVDLTKWM